MALFHSDSYKPEPKSLTFKLNCVILKSNHNKLWISGGLVDHMMISVDKLIT